MKKRVRLKLSKRGAELQKRKKCGLKRRDECLTTVGIVFEDRFCKSWRLPAGMRMKVASLKEKGVGFAMERIEVLTSELTVEGRESPLFLEAEALNCFGRK
ncbi:hypothetical protein TNCV_1940241 [Trichonephila clavipes]|nr:hypothetical protein TNCV_1940241 [Trichonephila clavipes]